jgi:hypothetical protein
VSIYGSRFNKKKNKKFRKAFINLKKIFFILKKCVIHFMNHFYIETKNLLTGQAAPFTGDSQTIARSRDACFTVFSSGEGTVRLQYNSPFFVDDWVDFYSFKNLTTGYAEPAFLTSPICNIRAVSEGTGNFWVGITVQN